LLFRGSFEVAGAGRGRKSQRAAASARLEWEKRLGLSVSWTALNFEFEGHQIARLDTPRHHDFSTDT
jgi:peptide chain release factor 3